MCIREIYRFTKLKQKLGANRVPFLLPSQAWYKILSLSRARQDRSGDPWVLERGDTDLCREKQKEREKDWEGREEEKDKKVENCASRENGKPENDHHSQRPTLLRFPTTPSRLFFSLYLLSVSFPRSPSTSLDTTPAIVYAPGS